MRSRSYFYAIAHLQPIVSKMTRNATGTLRYLVLFGVSLVRMILQNVTILKRFALDLRVAGVHYTILFYFFVPACAATTDVLTFFLP